MKKRRNVVNQPVSRTFILTIGVKVIVDRQSFSSVRPTD